MMGTSNIFQINLALSCYSIIILLFFFVSSCIRIKNDKNNLVFKMIIACTIISIIADVISRIEVYDGFIGEVVRINNYFYYLSNILLVLLWCLFVRFAIYINNKINKIIFRIAITLCIIIALVLVTNPVTKFAFFFDADGVYHRAWSFPIIIIISLFLFILIDVYIYINKNNINSKSYLAFLSFSFFPIIGTILQMLFFGVSYSSHAVVLSIMIVYYFIQNQNLDIDYLTGLYNRRKIEAVIRHKINNSRKNSRFGCILIDINHFKVINDTYGHIFGDEALVQITNRIKLLLPANVEFGRYGGDEFIIMYDNVDEEKLKLLTNKINAINIELTFKKEEKIVVTVAAGYQMYNDSYKTITEYLQTIDQNMYKSKKL